MNALAFIPSQLRQGMLSIRAINPRLMPVASFLVVVKTDTKHPLPVKDMILHLRDGGLPIAAIAEIVKVERKTVYSWIAGSETREMHSLRIEKLFQLFGTGTVDLRSIYCVWNRTLESGFSLRQMLTADVISKPAIQDALRILEPAIARHSERAVIRRAPRNGDKNPMIDEAPEAGFAQ